ncbi:MAG: hypothetical protein WKG07_19830 [Hymenobacter sp.]
MLAHVVTLPADRYTVVDANLIPTGELRPVKGTPFDFTYAPRHRRAHCVQVPGGYDHNWVLNRPPASAAAATVYVSATTGRTHGSDHRPARRAVLHRQLPRRLVDRQGGVRSTASTRGFCLETQHFPDSPNQPKFPNTILKPGETYHTTTSYTFGVRR